MSQKKSRRDALKMSFGVLVGLPAVTALNACTQCSKPDTTGAAPASAPTAAGAADAAATPATDAAATPAAAGGETLTLLSETDPTATGLNYKHNAADVPANLQTEKSGVPFSGQNCANCMFYAAAGQIEGADVGSCQLFANGKVKSIGWCASWAKKA